jgi:hypothetical protein
MPMTNVEIMKKVEMLSTELSANGGLMPPMVAKKFIVGAVASAPFLRVTRTVMMTEPEQTFPKLTIAGRVLHAANESETPPSANFVAPDTDEVSITTKELVAVVPLSDSVFEDNIEGKQLWNTVEGLMRKKCAADVQDNFVNGDITSADPDLALFDGLLALVTSNTVDASAAVWSSTLAVAGTLALDEEYLEQEKQNLRWLGSYRTELKYRLATSARLTGLGDILIEKERNLPVMGVEMINIPKWPTNQSPGSRTTEILMNPKQFVGGWHRNIKVEFERKATARKTYLVISVRVGCALEQELATASVYNISVA